MDTDAKTVQRLLETMWRIRAFEEAAAQCFSTGKIPGFIHTSIGQEAVAAGVCLALEPRDYILTTHRGHGHVVAKGANLDRMMAEIFGKATGYCRGRGGSMHVAAVEEGVLGANGIVGGGLSLAAGVGYAIRVRRSRQVVAVFFGDGAVAEGGFHESMNIAALWSLPVIFVCENNQYAEFSPRSIQTPIRCVAEAAQLYGATGASVDGNDALAVCAATLGAAARAREGKGPTLLECVTYRMRGHYEGDPVSYRPAGEAEAWRDRDPLRRLAEVALARGMLTVQTIADIEAQARAQVAQAVRYAEAAPPPDPADALKDVFA